MWSIYSTGISGDNIISAIRLTAKIWLVLEWDYDTNSIVRQTPWPALIKSHTRKPKSRLGKEWVSEEAKRPNQLAGVVQKCEERGAKWSRKRGYVQFCKQEGRRVMEKLQRGVKVGEKGRVTNYWRIRDPAKLEVMRAFPAHRQS